MGTRAARRGRQLPGLKAVREAKFLSQTDLARRAGLTQATIWELEDPDRPRGAYPVTIRKLAKALKVDPGVLVTEPARDKEPILTR